MKAASRKRTIRGRLPVTGYATSRTPKPSDGRALRARLKRERIAKAALRLAEAVDAHMGSWGGAFGSRPADDALDAFRAAKKGE